ncbi:hypothetical protein ACFV4K_15395 [Nocardia sp. NPDC059764]|uniref:hypothetical protein n=1 Tax=Nocardia sp. NPDC059764 TaxID=3346939 RepID=UPI0036472628
MTDIVPAAPRTLADPTLLDRPALLGTAAAEYVRMIQNTEQANAADWRVWLRFLNDLNSSLAEEDPHGRPIPLRSGQFDEKVGGLTRVVPPQ